jgi:hypothetical protein
MVSREKMRFRVLQMMQPRRGGISFGREAQCLNQDLMILSCVGTGSPGSNSCWGLLGGCWAYQASRLAGSSNRER